MDENPEILPSNEKPTVKGLDPLVYGCLVLAIAALVLGGAFLVGAWSVLQGQSPTPTP
ncbi:MAG: hypothetical protein SFU85_10130 [Candidatus Methylacidiphilales bacterium]|nr:hypothetical protein [Candidatus Methylacidiphilales bacterium]